MALNFNLLIVDDEDIAIRGIMKGINWEQLQYREVYTAMDAEEARDIIQSKQVHVVLSDIDMPNENGLQLLEWINEQAPNCVTLFLTGHADFKYAQQAVQLASFNYLLKPIDHGLLQQALQNAYQKAEELASLDSILATYDQFHKQWQLQRPLLVERFWHDVIHYRHSIASAYLESAMQNYSIPLQASSEIQLIQISIERWREEWSARDEEIMTYAIKNVAEEYFLINTDTPGHCIQDGQGILYLIIYHPEKLQHINLTELAYSFIGHCREHLHSYISCYISENMSLKDIHDGVQALQQLEKQNVTQTCTVRLEQEASIRTEITATAGIHFPDWIVLLETGKLTQLHYQIDSYFDKLQKAQVGYHELLTFYFGFMNSILQWLQAKGMNSTDVIAEQEWELKDGTIKSLARLKGWTTTICSHINGYMDVKGKQVSSVVEKVQQYMLEHLDEEFSREKLAQQVYLNPAYLSRLFRRETGLSLTDYLVKLRIHRAKEKLEASNDRISDIAIEVGYGNFSHFSKLFKKTTGLTPQEYRKKYGRL